MLIPPGQPPGRKTSLGLPGGQDPAGGRLPLAGALWAPAVGEALGARVQLRDFSRPVGDQIGVPLGTIKPFLKEPEFYFVQKTTEGNVCAPRKPTLVSPESHPQATSVGLWTPPRDEHLPPGSGGCRVTAGPRESGMMTPTKELRNKLF